MKWTMGTLLAAVGAQGMYDPSIPSSLQAIGGEYLVKVSGSQGACARVARDIDAIKAAKYGDQRGKVSDTASLMETCYVLLQNGDEILDQVKSIPGVRRVTKHVMHWPAVNPVSWGLARIDQKGVFQNEGLPFRQGYTGKGQVVYVLDTGINLGHLDFDNRASCLADFIQNTQEPCGDLDGHGSHCSGTAAGTMSGVGKDATIRHIKVCYGETGKGCPQFALIKGMEYAVKDFKANGGSWENSAVLSYSIGGAQDEAGDDFANAVSDSGIIMVVAAGNDNMDACTKSPAAAGGTASETYGVVTVGSSDIKDKRSSFSNYGGCVDIFAPGSDIVSAAPTGRSEWATLSGTSMATPHVSGVLLTLLEKYNGNKKKAMDELFASALPKVIQDDNEPFKMDFANLFLQVPLPEANAAPTAAPTAHPDFEAPETLQACVENECLEVGSAAFGADLEGKESLLYSGPIAFPSEEEGDFACNKADGNSSLTADYTGRVVVISRGTCAFSEKAKNAQTQGAVAVIIHNLAPGSPNFGIGGSGPDITIPVVSVAADDRSFFINRQNKIVKVGIMSRKPAVVVPVGPQVPTRPPVAVTARPTPSPVAIAPTAPTFKATRKPTPNPTQAPEGLCVEGDCVQHFFTMFGKQTVEDYIFAEIVSTGSDVATPENNCTFKGDYTGKVVFMDYRDYLFASCEYWYQSFQLAKQGAQAVVIQVEFNPWEAWIPGWIDAGNPDPFLLTPSEGDVTESINIPCFSTGYASGKVIQKNMLSTNKPMIRIGLASTTAAPTTAAPTTAAPTTAAPTAAPTTAAPTSGVSGGLIAGIAGVVVAAGVLLYVCNGRSAQNEDQKGTLTATSMVGNPKYSKDMEAAQPAN